MCGDSYPFIRFFAAIRLNNSGPSLVREAISRQTGDLCTDDPGDHQRGARWYSVFLFEGIPQVLGEHSCSDKQITIILLQALKKISYACSKMNLLV